MIVLLDANVLIAAVVDDHEQHSRVSGWLAGVDRFAVCPIVEGALVRFIVRMGESATTAQALLELVRAHPACEFWPDEPSYRDVDLTAVHGHRQVTDAYLAGVAAARRSVVATLDRGLAALRPSATLLIP